MIWCRTGEVELADRRILVCGWLVFSERRRVHRIVYRSGDGCYQEPQVFTQVDDVLGV